MGQPCHPGRWWWLPAVLLLVGGFFFPLLARQGIGFWGAGTCHRIVQHSFVIDGQQLPLCARCTAIYSGFLLAVGMSFLRGRRRPAGIAPPAIILVLLTFLALVGIDGANSYLSLFPFLPHLYDPDMLGSHTLRVLTGSLEGVALAGLLPPILHLTLWESPQQGRMIPNLPELGLILAAVGAADLLLLWHPPYSFYPIALFSLAGLVLLLGTTITPLVAVLARQAGRVRRWDEAATLLGWGALLSLLLLAGLAWLRFALLGSFTFSFHP